MSMGLMGYFLTPPSGGEEESIEPRGIVLDNYFTIKYFIR